MIKNNVYTVNPVMARALSNRSTQIPVNTPVSNMSVTEKAVLSSVQANIEPNQLAYSFVNVDGISLAADTSTSTLSVTYESPLNVSISGSSLLFKLIQNETQMFVSKAQVEEWTAKADGDHKHSGNDITTGTIPPEVLNNIPINKITGLENELNYLRNVTLNSYTKSEMDVKLLDIQTSLASTLEDMIGDLDNPIWKNPVGTFADIATAYPTPDPGWVATTIDTSIVYLYTGTQWLPISANSIPLATQTTAGLMSVDDKIRLDELISGGGSDGAATTLGGFTQDYFLNRSANAQEKTGDLTVANMYSKGAVVAHMTSNYSGITSPIAGTSILGFVKVDGTTITIDLDGTIHAIGSGAGSWSELSGKPADLVAIAALSGTSGLLKKTGVGTWTLDTNTYLQSSALDNYLALGGGIMSGTITKTASNTIPAFRYMSPTNSSLGAFTIYDSTSNESLAFATLSNISTFKFICGTSGYVPPTVTISQFSPSFEITKDNAKVLGNVVWHAGNFNPTSFNAASATYASAVTITADNSTNATNYVLFVNTATGNLSPRTDTAFSYNPSTNILTAGSFAGNFSGGTISGTTGTFSSDVTVSGSLRGNSGLELYHATPFIDFHYGNSTADYTSRIIENASGTLSIQANANVTGNMIATGAVIAHATGSWTNTLPIASSSILGTIIAGTSLNVTGAGVLDLKIDHYTTTSGYTSRVSKVRTFEMALTAGTLGANAVELYSLTNYPTSTVYALTATFVAYTGSTVGVPIVASVRKGSSNWELLLYNSSGGSITKTTDMKVNLIGLMTV